MFGARWSWGLAVVSLAVFGCDGTSGTAVGPLGGPGAAPAEWPGGTAGGFEDGDGVEESWHREPGAGSGDLAEADGAADRGAGGPTAGGGAAEDPGAAPPPGDPQGGGLEGGEIDDNDDFAAFLEYALEAVERFAEDPMLRWLDVERRHLVTVRDRAGRTVPDATVEITDGEARVAWGRTRADGRYAFFPGAYGSDADAYTVRVTAEAAKAEGRIARGAETLIVALDADRPAQAAFRVDVAFVIDATGSMGEEIGRIKTTVTDIAAAVAGSDYAPDLRFALVDYRDFGDAYVTHAVNFTRDVQAFQGAISALEANGGGDGPEALNEALHETMRRLEWRPEATLRLAFVIADAPAHYYEQATYTYDHAMLDAAAMGVKIFPIASGGSDGIAELQFRQLAQFTLGHFVFITEGGGSPRGSGGSDYDVDPQDFVVEQLDALVVRLITDEMAAWTADDVAPR